MAADELDLGLAEDTPLPAPATSPWTPDRTRENFRGIIASFLIFIMASVIIAMFVLFWLHPDRSEPIEHFFGLIFGPVVALVGSATGYYFGSQSKDKL